MDVTLEQVKELIAVSVEGKSPHTDAYLNRHITEQMAITGQRYDYYDLFYRLAQAFKPGLVVELGAWRGLSAASFAAGHPQGQVVTIDIHKDDKLAQSKTIEAAGHYPNLTYLNGWTWNMVETVKKLGQPIDILFIDSWHEYQYLKRDWDDYSPLLAQPSLVIVDDVYDQGSIEGQRFWDELPGEKYLDKQIHGKVPMGFLIYGLSDNRPAGGTEPATVKKPVSRKSPPKGRARKG